MVNERQDITGSNSLKGASGRVIVDEKGIKDSNHRGYWNSKDIGFMYMRKKVAS